MIEFATFYEDGYGKFGWIIWKNVLLIGFGVFALIFGSKDAIQDILKLYTSES